MNGKEGQLPSLGALGEKLASQYLKKDGYSIVERNYRIRNGEIDIIAKNNGELIFVEIKTRSTERYGYPEEGVTFLKKKRMATAIRSYLLRFPSQPLYRIDIVAITINSFSRTAKIRHIRNIEFPEI